jgi:hypothetical protein
MNEGEKVIVGEKQEAGSITAATGWVWSIASECSLSFYD